MDFLKPIEPVGQGWFDDTFSCHMATVERQTVDFRLRGQYIRVNVGGNETPR